MRITVKTYEELEENIETFFGKYLDLLVITGRGGTGKTYELRKHIDDGTGTMISGEIAPLATYKTLWEHKDEPIVLDDIETLMSDKKRRSLLKKVADTYDVKQLSWGTTSPQIKPAPESFETTSNVCMVCNEFPTKGLNRKAILSRGLVVDFWPTDEELVDRMKTVTKNYECELSLDERYEVFQFIKDWITVAEDANLRSLVIGFQLREAGRNWRDILSRGLSIDRKMVLADEVLRKNDTVKDAKWEFVEQSKELTEDGSKLSPRTFGNWKKKLEKLGRTY